MNVLSLFDGMSCGRIALEQAGITVTRYFASEVDKHAISVSQDNWPDIIRIGDVRFIHITYNKITDITRIYNYSSGEDYSFKGKIDLIIAGSPCQDLRPGREGLKGKKSILFYEFMYILKMCRKIKPEIDFLLENVAKISQEDKNIISELLDVEPVPICSSLFSAQKRKRLYWTSIIIPPLPQISSLVLDDIIQDTLFDEYLSEQEIERAAVNHSAKTWHSGNKMGSVKFPTPTNEKSKTLITLRIKGDRAGNHIRTDKGIRLLNISEYEILQTLPKNYTSAAPLKERFKMIGNGWTSAAITHIFTGLLYDETLL